MLDKIIHAMGLVKEFRLGEINAPELEIELLNSGWTHVQFDKRSIHARYLGIRYEIGE